MHMTAARVRESLSRVDIVTDVPAAEWDQYVAAHAEATLYHRAAWKGDLPAVRCEVRRAPREEDRPVSIGAHQRNENAGPPKLRRLDGQRGTRADDAAQTLQRRVIETRHGSTANGVSSTTGIPSSA